MLPTIETERLTLRQIEKADDASHAALWAKLDVIRYFQPQPKRAVEFAASNAELYGELWRRRSERKLLVPFAVIERSTRAFIGHAGVTTHSGLKVPEFTILLDNTVWRRGYGTECGIATLRYAFELRQPEYVIAIVLRGNIASHKLMKKLGFRDSGQYKQWHMKTTLYRLYYEDWKRASWP